MSTSTLLRHGDPAEEILAVAEQQNADLIVLAAHSHNPAALLLFDIVSADVLRRAPCPVLVYGERAAERHAAAGVPGPHAAHV